MESGGRKNKKIELKEENKDGLKREKVNNVKETRYGNRTDDK